MDHSLQLREVAESGIDAGADADDVQDLQNVFIQGAFAHLESTHELLAFLFLPPVDRCMDHPACLEICHVYANIYASCLGNKLLAIWEDKDDWEVYLNSMCSAAHYHECQSFWNGFPSHTE